MQLSNLQLSNQDDEEEQEAPLRPAGSMLYGFQLHQMCEAKPPTGHYSGHGPFQEEFIG